MMVTSRVENIFFEYFMDASNDERASGSFSKKLIELDGRTTFSYAHLCAPVSIRVLEIMKNIVTKLSRHDNSRTNFT